MMLEDIIIMSIVLGVPGSVAAWWRHMRELRHARRVELELAKHGHVVGHPLVTCETGGIPPIPPIPGRRHARRGTVSFSVEMPRPRSALPAAGPPPRTRRVIDRCRHDLLVAVRDPEGVVLKWICKNTRCDAEFPADTCIYHDPEDSPPEDSPPDAGRE